MHSISKLKRWLSLVEAAETLSRLLESDVTEAEVLRLALDHHLELSAVFIDGTDAAIWNAVDESKLTFKQMPVPNGHSWIDIPEGGPLVSLSDGTLYQKTGWGEDKRVWLATDCPFTLAMIGGELADVQRRYWMLEGFTKEPTSNLDGTFLVSGEGPDRQVLGLLESFRSSSGETHFDAGALPQNTVFVVTPRAIETFVRSLGGDAGSKKEPAVHFWPWGTYHTQRLGHLEAAAARFWRDFDPSNLRSAPKATEVVDWLKARGVTHRVASAIATILRPDDLPPGPRT